MEVYKKMARKKEEVSQGQLSDKDKIIDLAMKQIQKEYGEGSIMKLGEKGVVKTRFYS